MAISALLCAAAARAQDGGGQSQPQPAHAQAPLSKEDAELVKQLALLERLELVKDLELFEEKGDTLSGDRPDDKVTK